MDIEKCGTDTGNVTHIYGLQKILEMALKFGFRGYKKAKNRSDYQLEIPASMGGFHQIWDRLFIIKRRLFAERIESKPHFETALTADHQITTTIEGRKVTIRSTATYTNGRIIFSDTTLVIERE